MVAILDHTYVIYNQYVKNAFTESPLNIDLHCYYHVRPNDTNESHKIIHIT